jgi:broad specificity phosphatase PhoE
MIRTVLLLLFLLPSLALAGEPNFIYLVRHAEKVDDSRDPELSDAGRARAVALTEFFAEIHVDAVFATEYQRTRDTVAGIAQARDLEVTVHPARDSAGLAEKLTAMDGQTTVIAGHSNTVPAIIAALGGPTLEIDHSDYENLFLVVLVDGKAHLQQYRFVP